MSSQLDPAILAAITAEARQCFLDEDAPEYLQMLADGYQDREHPNFNALLRAAHSLKGGAGLASLDSLQQLAHKLEDVLVALQQGTMDEKELAWALVEKSIDEIGYVISQARTVEGAIANPELIIALEALVDSDPESAESMENMDRDGQDRDLIRQALTEDLENSLVVIEELAIDAEEETIRSLLAGFVDECTFLAETLELPWLAETIAPIAEALETVDTTEALLLTKEIIVELRDRIADYLENSESIAAEALPQESNLQLVIDTLNQDLDAMCQAIADLAMDTPEEVINEALTDFTDECTFLGETLELPWLIEAVAPVEQILAECDPLEALLTVQELVGEIRQRRDEYLAGGVADEEEAISISEVESLPDSSPGFFDLPEDDDELSTVMFAPPVAEEKVIAKVAETQKSAAGNQVRISLTSLEEMSDRVEELILSQSRINRQQQILHQANRRLRSLTRKFEPIREQIQTLYDRLAVNSTSITSDSNSGDRQDTDTAQPNSNFDSLELDRYTDLHGSLQAFQELMLQIQETRTDLDLVDRELSEDLEQTEKNLNILYTKVTDSRLVPFDVLAKRFIPQLHGLSRRFDKPVDLNIEGKNIPVDQILLEQLQTPLTHLLNNAFDHGIENKYDRLAANKPETATIILQARLQNDRLVITIQDDGGGIDTQKVYRRAVDKGICPPEKAIADFTSEEIINWIFEPDFSTAAKVSDLSGRGMGLDIVLNLIRQLRGQLYVTTEVGVGTTFTISLPLNLSLQSLLLVQLQNRTIAIPHTSVLEILPYRELCFTDKTKKYLKWQNQTVTLSTLKTLFPCPRKPLRLSQGKVGMILETAFEPVAILVDAIAGEEKSIVKPFDETVPVPTYVVGCTVLGTGEVIPVILPQGINQNAIAPVSVANHKATFIKTASTVLIAEDSVATRRMLDKILTAAGYQTIVCRDGQEALEQIEQARGKIDLILSDVEMPRLNGFALLEKVRTIPAFKNTPIVMATSRTGDRHKQEAQRLGATDYLGKPVQPQQLLDKVATLLTVRSL